MHLHGIEVKAPWDLQDTYFPPPHPMFLEVHYFTSISKAMKGNGDDDDDDDDEELPSPEGIQNRHVRIWPECGRETPLDLMAETKNSEVLTMAQGPGLLNVD